MKRNHVGIDVSAKTFTTIIDHEGARTEAFDLTDRRSAASRAKEFWREYTGRRQPARVALSGARRAED